LKVEGDGMLDPAPGERAARRPRGPRAAPDPETVQRFAALAVTAWEQLDWPLLEGLYCEGDASGFFGPQQRQAVLEAALAFGADLGETLSVGGASRYVGAGVAELVPLLAETLLLGRRVSVETLPGPEVDELDRVLAALQSQAGVDLPRFGGPRPAGGRWDHLWLASVLTDPEAFPALHLALYERGKPGRAALAGDRERALALLARSVAGLAPGSFVTTSEEELGLVAEALATRGLHAVVPRRGRLSPIVGDVLLTAPIRRLEGDGGTSGRPALARRPRRGDA
jgi:hypothetical protein